jgi:tropomyosin-1
VKREDVFDKTIEDLRAQLAQAEKHGSEADRTIAKLQREVDRMQDEVLQTKMQYQSLRDEIDPYAHEIRAN